MRQTTLPDFQSIIYDVIVVGGGINGSGIARDLALRGISLLLLDNSDPTRASRNNSHLGHGGLRYLANLDFQMVRDSRKEINNLLKNAPHLVRPIRMLIPVFEGDEHPLWQLKLGMAFYDSFVEKSRLPKHQCLSTQQVRSRLPGLTDTATLKGGVLYYDTQIVYPERICYENLLEAQTQSAPGQPVQTYKHMEVTRIAEANDYLEVTFCDKLDLSVYQAKGRFLVNTTGHHVDKLIDNTDSAYKPQKPLLGPTKGTHIIIDNTFGVKDTVYSPSRVDGRPFFIIPFPANETENHYSTNQLLIGTTDDKTWQSDYPEPKEIEYLLLSTNALFKNWNLKPEHVVQAFSGFRPLPASHRTEGNITRRHLILQPANSRMLHIIGGKLTTFRQLSEEVGDKLVKELRHNMGSDFTQRLKNGGHSLTADRPLPGGAGIEEINTFKKNHIPQAAQHFNIAPEIIEDLIDRYGSFFNDVLALTMDNPDNPIQDPALMEPFTTSAPFIKAQILYAIRNEQAETLMDIMVGCLQLDRFPGAGMDGVKVILEFLSIEKGVSTLKQSEMWEGYQTYIKNQNNWRFPDESLNPYQARLSPE